MMTNSQSRIARILASQQRSLRADVMMVVALFGGLLTSAASLL